MANRTAKPHKSTFTTVTRLSPTQQVRDQLTLAIQRREYEPGALLPSERMLCEAFGVSRVSVREALAGLEATGMITVQHGRGAFVRLGVADRFEYSAYMQLHRDELVDLLKIRGALDGLAAEEAAERPADGDLQGVLPAHRAFVEAVERGANADTLVPLDVAFHLSIAEAAGSQLLPGLLKELNGMLEESRRIQFSRERQPPLSAKQHQAIVEAILAHDVPAARRAAVKHVREIADWLAAAPAAETVVGDGRDIQS
jgi:GntR family transcriptional regulator, transcriptional repressor for pyruvate dehydrogenase complex